MDFPSKIGASWHYVVGNTLARFHRYQAAADAYGRVLRVFPDEQAIHFRRFWCQLQVPSCRAEGIVLLERRLSLAPSAYGFYLLACGFQGEGRHAEAVAAFRRALQLEASQTSEFFAAFAVSLRIQRCFDDAVDAYRSAAQLDPSNPEAWENLGGILAELDRWTDAAPCFERASRLAPSVGRSRWLSYAQEEVGRLEAAEQSIRQALTIDPRSVEANEQLVHLLLMQERDDEAVALARKLRAADPECVPFRLALAGALCDGGNLEEALAEVKAAEAMAPTNAEVYDVLASVHVEMGNADAALTALEESVRCAPLESRSVSLSQKVWHWVARGSALSTLGRHTEAVAAFDVALGLDPELFHRESFNAAFARYEVSSREAARTITPPSGS